VTKSLQKSFSHANQFLKLIVDFSKKNKVAQVLLKLVTKAQGDQIGRIFALLWVFFIAEMARILGQFISTVKVMHYF
jgi:hypothetical protein